MATPPEQPAAFSKPWAPARAQACTPCAAAQRTAACTSSSLRTRATANGVGTMSTLVFRQRLASSYDDSPRTTTELIACRRQASKSEDTESDKAGVEVMVVSLVAMLVVDTLRTDVDTATGLPVLVVVVVAARARVVLDADTGTCGHRLEGGTRFGSKWLWKTFCGSAVALIRCIRPTSEKKALSHVSRSPWAQGMSPSI
mmetsp:Transcript_28672/g.72474  ORF Transcript_28672/g.72474 Transcript_28672/m.72474 type:complete len:200 (+) Transcript_28672:787-1386(+)